MGEEGEEEEEEEEEGGGRGEGGGGRGEGGEFAIVSLVISFAVGVFRST